MKYVLLGSISPSWLGKQAERLKKSNEKLKQLGIKQDAVRISTGFYYMVFQKRIWKHSDAASFWRSGNTEDNKKRIKILKYLNRVLRNISDITYADIITPYI